MPSNDEHAQHSYLRYGVRAEDLHSWMDEPHKLYGNAHRWVRHQKDDVRNPPKWAIDKYGLERTRDVMMDHILFDKERSERQPRANWNVMGKRRHYEVKYPYCEHCGEKILKTLPTGQVLCGCGQYRPSERWMKASGRKRPQVKEEIPTSTTAAVLAFFILTISGISLLWGDYPYYGEGFTCLLLAMMICLWGMHTEKKKPEKPKKKGCEKCDYRGYTIEGDMGVRCECNEDDELYEQFVLLEDLEEELEVEDYFEDEE